ncbi:MAG: CoA pyrophosphatase [Candidatus Aminicenantes bacterium]|nr:CoA pyrophosphatase [Candidatus Aminicenantes bacterium]
MWETIDGLHRIFEKPPPGYTAQEKMIPIPRIGHRPVDAPGLSFSQAAVLLLLYIKNGGLHLVFTRRSGQVRHHQDQISFPGGAKEKDEGLDRTALRETGEELGVPTDEVVLLGKLSPLYVPPSGFCIYPFVGVTPVQPRFTPADEEVAEIIEVPLVHLLEDQTVEREDWIIRGRPVEVPFYRYKDWKIWGATAMILSEFLEMVRGTERPMC